MSDMRYKNVGHSHWNYYFVVKHVAIGSQGNLEAYAFECYATIGMFQQFIMTCQHQTSDVMIPQTSSQFFWLWDNEHIVCIASSFHAFDSE